MITLKIILFCLATMFMYCFLKNEYKKRKKNIFLYKKEGLTIFNFTLKIPFFISLYFILINALTEQLPELIPYGNYVYHLIFNNFTYSVCISIITAFIFHFFTLVNDIKNQFTSLEMTKFYLDNMLNDYFGKVNFKDKTLKEYFDNNEKINYKELSNHNLKLSERRASKPLNCKDASLKNLELIGWLDKDPLLKIIFSKIKNSMQTNNKFFAFKLYLICLIEIDKIFESSFKYVWDHI